MPCDDCKIFVQLGSQSKKGFEVKDEFIKTNPRKIKEKSKNI